MMAVFGSALADDAEIAELIKPDSSISVGIGNWSADRQQRGIYDGMNDKGAYGLVDVDIVKRNDSDGSWLNVSGRNLGLDSREFSADYLRQGDIGVGFDYSRTSRENPLNVNTGLRSQGQGQTLVTIVPGRGADINIGTTRDAAGLRFYKNLMKGLDFNVSFKNEEKNGSRLWGRGGAPEFAVEPIDSTTRQFEARLDYVNGKLQLSGGYNGSWYENHNSMVTSTLNAAPIYLSLPLDNQAHQLFVEGGYSFTPTTRGTFKASYGRAMQDENIPTRFVSGLSWAGAPYSLNGRVDTTLVQLGVTSRPIKELSLVANLRYHDLDDKTPERRFIQTNAACGAGQCIENTPFSYRTLTGKLEATYRLPYNYSVTAGLDRKDQERNIPFGNKNAAGVDLQRVVPMRSDIDELTYRVEARKSMSETVNGSISYLRTDRDGSTYTRAGSGSGGAAADYVNPINIADRIRDKFRLGLDWTPLEKLSTQFSYENARDNYDTKSNRPYGLIDGSASIYTLDTSYTFSDDWSLSAWYSHDDTKARQRNGDLTTASFIRTADLREKGDSVGVGVRGKVFARLTMGADLQWSKTVSEYPQMTNAGVSNNLPDIENKLTRLALFAKYSLDKNSDIRMDFVHERWSTDDWTWQFANGSPFTYGSVTDGTTVTMDKKQSANFIGARYIYKFQ